MKGREYKFKTKVQYTDPPYSACGTSRTVIRHFDESDHFEIYKYVIMKKDDYDVYTCAEILREGKNYVYLKYAMPFSKESVLKTMSIFVGELEREMQ